METVVKKLKGLLRKRFPGSDLEIERPYAGGRLGGLMTWNGFTGIEQIERQRLLWQELREKLPPRDQLQIAAIMTLTPDEMAAARDE